MCRDDIYILISRRIVFIVAMVYHASVNHVIIVLDIMAWRQTITRNNTRLTDAGAFSGLSRTSRELMTTVQGVICLLNIKDNIF